MSAFDTAPVAAALPPADLPLPVLPSDEGFPATYATAHFDKSGVAHVLDGKELSTAQRENPAAVHTVIDTQISELSAFTGDQGKQISLAMAARTLIHMDNEALAGAMSWPLSPNDLNPSRQADLAQAVFAAMAEETSPETAAQRMETLLGMTTAEHLPKSKIYAAWTGSLTPEQTKAFDDIAPLARPQAAANTKPFEHLVADPGLFDLEAGAKAGHSVLMSDVAPSEGDNVCELASAVPSAKDASVPTDGFAQKMKDLFGGRGWDYNVAQTVSRAFEKLRHNEVTTAAK